MKYKLEELIESISDTRKINKSEVILINTSDVENGEVLNHNYVKNQNLRGQFKKRFKKGDILYSEIRPKNKRFAYIDFDSEDYIASTKLMVLRKNNALIDNDYLFYLLKSDSMINKLQMLAESRSGTFPQITFDELKRIEVEVPELEQQRKNIKILVGLDKRISLNNQINDNLLNILRNYFKKYCIDNVNENWKEKKLENIVSIRRGASPRPIQNFLSMEGINWLKISDVTGIDSPFIYNIKEKIIEEGKTKSVFIDKGTLVVSNSATPGIPKFIMVDTCVHDGWLVLSDYEKKYKNYLYFLIEQIRDSLIKLANGSVFNNLKTDILKQYRFYNPDDETLNKFNSIAEPVMKMINNNTFENINLEKIRDALLPKLMNGEIDLDKIEI